MFTYIPGTVRCLQLPRSVTCTYFATSSLSNLAKTAHSFPNPTSRAFNLTTTMSTDASLKTFFSSPNFAVVGASSNTAKFGHKSKIRAHEKPEAPSLPRYRMQDKHSPAQACVASIPTGSCQRIRDQMTSS